MNRRHVRQRILRLDPGLLVALAICLLAIWPFISRSALPQATDAELHIFRLAELGRLFRAGEPFPRWAPNFYYGYGYPIFNYYAPLAYYVGLVPDLMPFWNAVDAVKIVFILGILLGGLGTYSFSARNWGRLPALVATAAYVYAPYILFVDPHARGDLAEAFSFGVFPLAMWALDRLRSEPRASSWLIAAGSVALVILSHNLMALVFSVVLVGWCLWVHLANDVPPLNGASNKVLRPLLHFRIALALLAGVGLAACFWLVVALERDAVNLGSLIGLGDNFDFRTHFVSLGELLSPARIMDWSATAPDYVMGLGLFQWLLAVVGLVFLVTGRVKRRKQAIYFAIAAAVLVFLMSPGSRPVWEGIPFLAFLQFPWRLLGPAAFALAVLSAVGAGALMQVGPNRVTRWLPATLVGVTMLGALPLIQVPPWPADFGPTTTQRVLQEELAGRWLGTTSTSDFVPATVDSIPRPEQSLLEDFAAGRPLDRVNRHTLPEGTTVISEEITPLNFRYQINGEEDFLLRLYLFEFPGWHVRLDGQTAERELGRPEGFIVVPVPAGRHVLEVDFGGTPARRLAYAVSALAAALAVGYGLLLRSNHALLPVPDIGPAAKTPGDKVGVLAVALVALVIAAANALLIEPLGWLRIQSPPLSAIPAQVDQYSQLDDQIALIGYDAPSAAGPGETVKVTLYWQALRTPETNYQVFVHLVDASGRLVAQSDALNPGGFPTENWPTEKYVRDEHTLALPADMASGTYRLWAGLWLAADGTRLPLVDPGGRMVGDSIELSQALVVE